MDNTELIDPHRLSFGAAAKSYRWLAVTSFERTAEGPLWVESALVAPR